MTELECCHQKNIHVTGPGQKVKRNRLVANSFILITTVFEKYIRMGNSGKLLLAVALVVTLIYYGSAKDPEYPGLERMLTQYDAALRVWVLDGAAC